MMQPSIASRTALHAQPILAAGPPYNQAAEPIALAHQLDQVFRFVAQHVVSLPDPYACCILFFTVTAEKLPVTSFSIRRVTVHAAWREGATRVRQWAWAHNADAVELRVDWACGIQPAANSHHPARSADPARTWALADDELEHTELLTALGNNTSRDLADMQSLIDPVHVSTHARWQLLLEGVYIDASGALTALPRPRMSPRHLQQGPAGTMLHRATVQHITHRQSEDGSWVDAGSILDHLGITYALLLSQQHARREQRHGDKSALACHRAVAYLMEQLHRWSLKDDASEPLLALSLIVLLRYTKQYPGAASSAAIRGLMAQLTQSLRVAASSPQKGASPWAALAMEALRQHTTHDGADQLLPPSPNHGSYDGSWLHATWPLLRQIADEGGRQTPLSDPWLAIAYMECSLRQGRPQFLSDTLQAQFQTNMQTLFRVCYQRIVWPEVALFQTTDARRHAAFFSPRSGNALVSDCRVTGQLLIALMASINFSCYE